MTEIGGSAAPSELNKRAVGDDWRRSLGELVRQPFCLDMWISTGMTATTVLAPKLGRTSTTELASVAIADFLHFGYAASDQAA